MTVLGSKKVARLLGVLFRMPRPAVAIDSMFYQEIWLQMRPYWPRLSPKLISFILVWLFTAISASSSEEKCIPRVGYLDSQAGRQFAGMFQITLGQPNLNSILSVQSHLVHSLTWAVIISRELSDRTQGRCVAVLTPDAFPNLRVFLQVSQSTKQIDREKSVCVSVLEEALLQSQPSDQSINRAAQFASDALHAAGSGPTVSDITDAANILEAALPVIYENASLMHALVSVDLAAFRSLEATNFRFWLQRQRSTGSLRLEQISHCLPSIDSSVTSATTKTLRRHSHIIPPGPINILRGNGGPMPAGPLRNSVIVGNAEGPYSARDLSEVAAKYCNNDFSFPVDGGQVTLRKMKARIRCMRTTIYDLDAWTLLYCDRQDCASESAEKATMTALVNDPGILRQTNNNSGNGTPRGPYLVTIKK